ncbi:MAG TPA: hypothetical protein VL943_05645, partial [Niabella sp.]|nr:hypothetical protein [Niabella sp.]
PLLWVTRAAWVLLVTLLLHLVFFALGWNVFRNPLLLQDYNANDIYIRNGVLLLSIICSVLIIVVWLIVLFRHNTFKNYYPTSRWQLFSSFVICFIVFLFSTTFYSSYQMGYKEYIGGKYTNAVYNKKLEQSNLAAAFLSFNQEDYTIDKRRYPAPFDTLYCEVSEAFIDFSKPYISRFTDEYQFFTLKKSIKTVTGDAAVGGELPGHLYSEALDDTTWTVWDKDKVVDVSALATPDLSYFNYSRVLFTEGYYDEGPAIYVKGTPRFDENQQKSQALNQQLYQLLKRNKEQEIRQLFSSFLATAKEFRIRTNLTVQSWLPLIDRDNFIVKKFVYNGDYRPNDWEYDEQVATSGEAAAAAAVTDSTDEAVRSQKQEYFEKGRTQLYLDANALKNVFGNIDAIKKHNHWEILFQMQCWLAFGLSLVLFIFRSSGLSSLLFSIIAGIVVAIALSLAVVGLNIHDELAISYLAFIIGTTILVIPLLLLKRIRKNIQAIFINISIMGFVPYVLLIMGIISMHQKNYYQAKLGALYYKQTPQPVLLEQLGMDLSTYLLIAGFLFMLLYTSVVKRWKALPEG